MNVDLWLVSFTLTVWIAVGFAGQLLFSARFIVQWVLSERKGRSNHWHFSDHRQH